MRLALTAIGLAFASVEIHKAAEYLDHIATLLQALPH